MKKLLVTLILAAHSVGFAQTITNGVKGSLLPAASTPLAGTELTFVIQSGTTKNATVAQVIAAATAQNIATSNALQTAVTGEIANRATAITTAQTIATNLATSLTNALVAQGTALTNSIATVSNAMMTASNVLQTAITADGTTALANLRASNTVYAAAISGVSNSIALGVTNGGAVRFSTVTATNYGQPAIGLGQWNTTQSTSVSNINFGLGGLQILTLGNGTGLNNLSLLPTNMIDGQQVYLLVKTPSASYKLSSGTPTGYTVLPAGAVVTTGSGGNALLNWIVISNTIVFSGGAL